MVHTLIKVKYIILNDVTQNSFGEAMPRGLFEVSITRAVIQYIFLSLNNCQSACFKKQQLFSGIIKYRIPYANRKKSSAVFFKPYFCFLFDVNLGFIIITICR